MRDSEDGLLAELVSGIIKDINEIGVVTHRSKPENLR